MMLADFTAWQYELAIIASRFKLGLLSDDEIIAFTHKLMDNGYYDDLMLEIIDDDPLYPSLLTQENFTLLYKKLNLPVLSIEQIKYLNTFYELSLLIIRPFKLEAPYFYTQPLKIREEIEWLLVYIGEPETFISDEFQTLAFKLDDIIDYIFIFEYDENDTHKMVIAFLIECENWINRNQSKILEIMHQLFPKNLRE